MTTRCNISPLRMRDVHICALRKTEAEPFLTDKTLKSNQENKTEIDSSPPSFRPAEGLAHNQTTLEIY